MSKKSARQEKILEALTLNPALRVFQLAQELGVSAETVRRDLSELDVTGKLNRTYGGAVRSQTFEPALAERLLLNVRERQAIANKAVQRVGHLPTLLVGGGSSALHFARALRKVDQAMTVITPAYSIAQELSVNPRIQVECLPGQFHGSEGLVYGADTIEAVKRFHVPMVVLGASGISADGPSEALLGVGQLYQAMLAASSEIMFLADCSKFDKRALVLLGTWQANMTVVTDALPPKPLLSAIQNQGARVEIAA